MPLIANFAYTICACCSLPQPPGIDKVTGVTARVCNDCTNHQGDQDRKRVQRAESHERMLRQRMDACRASEAEARRQMATAKADSRDARERTAFALASRGRLAARVVEAATDSRVIAAIARDPNVVKWARQASQPAPYTVSDEY